MDSAAIDIAPRLNRSQGRERRSRSFGTKLTRAEEAELYQAAKAEGKYAGEWARDVLLREARRSQDDALFTEVVATRMLLVNLIKPMLLGKPVPENWITEAMNGVRAAKHKAAADLRKEYAARDRKES
ncbi:hypothetical protein [Edaphobacter modestus]|jgi:hypothetical protein|uniref:Uncharacterized protein n=1 Tax=Edaphobacter modestus TaxID=388466 RepID=A0A4Q7YE96_9BACT|nr:hypothetical protein [Edaphobacter modestus]RZU34615.1 hypothetical protein BDD14_6113 [Edaphobacter modestus]